MRRKERNSFLHFLKILERERAGAGGEADGEGEADSPLNGDTVIMILAKGRCLAD